MYVVLGILYGKLRPSPDRAFLPAGGAGGGAGHPLAIWRDLPRSNAFIGLFLLMGIVKKNGIMMIDFAFSAWRNGQTASMQFTDASMNRFRPDHHDHPGRLMGALDRSHWASAPTAPRAGRWGLSSSAD